MFSGLFTEEFKHAILFPRARKFSDFFTLDPNPPLYDSNGMRVWRKIGGEPKCKVSLSSYCYIPSSGRYAMRSLAVVPRPNVIRKLNGRLVVTGGRYSLYFEIVRQSGNPKEGLVVVKYNDILASLYLGYIDMTGVPRDTARSSITRAQRESGKFMMTGKGNPEWLEPQKSSK